MSIISTTKELIDLAKKGATIELELRLVQMQENELQLREEIVKLKTELAELKNEAHLSKNLELSHGMYNVQGVFYCQVCKDAKDKLIRLQSSEYEKTDEYERLIEQGTKYTCLNCNSIYYEVEHPRELE